MNNKRVIYEGIHISVRALTLFIAIGLLTLSLLIWYAAAQGSVFEGGTAEISRDVSEEQTVIETATRPTPAPTNGKDKINQRFIDKW